MIREGSIIGFSGTGFLSGAINVGTGAMPGSGLCHIGIVSRHPKTRDLVLFESTMLMSDAPRDYCAVLNRAVKGVQAHTLQHAIIRRGPVWHYPLRSKLSLAQRVRLNDFVVGKLGAPYDLPQAGASFGLAIRAGLRAFIRREQLDSLFCSELVGAAVDEIYPGSFPNASVWNPNTCARHLVECGIYAARRRLT